MKSATVVIEAFGPNSPKQDKVLTFQVDTDRSLLTDLNESFQVKSRQLKRRTRSIELDEDAVADAAEKDDTPTKGGTTGAESDSSDRRYDEAATRSFWTSRFFMMAFPSRSPPIPTARVNSVSPSQKRTRSFRSPSARSLRIASAWYSWSTA